MRITIFRALLCAASVLALGLPDRALAHDPYVTQVKVVTGNAPDAGTDANVYMTFYGKDERGKSHTSAEIRLDNKQNNFERGDTDIFVVYVMPVGDITKIRLRHDNKGKKPGWFVDTVTLTMNDGGTKQFSLHRWLASDEADHTICIEGFPDEMHKPSVPCR